MTTLRSLIHYTIKAKAKESEEYKDLTRNTLMR